MADFSTSYEKWIKPGEGGYANIPQDKGGETYGGIARNFHPTWSGWAYIDAAKAKFKNGIIPTNTKFPELDAKVKNFYLLGMWNPNNFGLINNQSVADILFDWFVNSSSNAVNTKAVETYGVDEILNRDFAKKLPIDSKFDIGTINAINAVDSAKLHNIVKAERINFYNWLYAKNPTDNKVFISGWLKRINKFPTLKQTAIGLGGIITVTGLFFLVRYVVKKVKEKKKK